MFSSKTVTFAGLVFWSPSAQSSGGRLAEGAPRIQEPLQTDLCLLVPAGGLHGFPETHLYSFFSFGKCRSVLKWALSVHGTVTAAPQGRVAFGGCRREVWTVPPQVSAGKSRWPGCSPPRASCPISLQCDRSHRSPSVPWQHPWTCGKCCVFLHGRLLEKSDPHP